MSSAQDFLDKLRVGRLETKAAAESIHPWTRLRAMLENGNENQSAIEKAAENPIPTLGNATPKLAPAVPIHKAMQQNPPPPAEPGGDANALTPEQIKGYEAKIGKIFNPKHFGKLIAPAIRNSIRKALKEQLPNLDYRDPGFIKKFEEINENVTKIASKTAGEFGLILEEYKAAVGSLAGISVESGALAEE